MRKIFLCVLLCTGLFSVASAEQPRPEMARYTKAYSGATGSHQTCYMFQGDSAELRLTGQPWTSTLSYDRELVSSQPPQHLLTAFLEQK